MNMLTHWSNYKHGIWRRIGNEIECYACQKTLPSGLLPLENAHVTEYHIWTQDYKYYIRVKIKGWETKTVTYSTQNHHAAYIPIYRPQKDPSPHPDPFNLSEGEFLTIKNGTEEIRFIPGNHYKFVPGDTVETKFGQFIFQRAGIYLYGKINEDEFGLTRLQGHT